MFNEIKNNIKDADIVIHAAAVSDFTIENKPNKKIKSDENLHLELTPTTKIFEKIKKLKKGIILVGFKAEYNVSEKILVERTYGLLKDANADFVVANDVGRTGRGFDVETNEVYIVDKNKKAEHIDLADKSVVGNRILDRVKMHILSCAD